MALELYYTSVPKGLKPESTGFCTVAVTTGMPQAMIQKLESLGGYRPVFDVGSPHAGENPPVFAHWRVNVGGVQYSVLSHVCFAGADHQGRFNKLAHHVVVESSEMPPAGPAWVMMQAGVIDNEWSGQPRILHSPKIIPDGTNPLRICEKWKELTGDAGWAGMFAQAVILDASKPAYIIYEPRTNILPLINEAVSLLPEKMRWKVTFNTYFDTLPAGLTCSWRCCVAGTPAAKSAAANATSGILIDLTGSVPPPPDNMYVQLARTGRRIEGSDTAGDERVIIAPEIVSQTEQKPSDIISHHEPPKISTDHQLPASRKKMLFWAVAILWPIVMLVAGGFFLAAKFKPEQTPDIVKPAENLTKKLAERDKHLDQALQQIEKLRDYNKKLKLQAQQAEKKLAQAQESLAAKIPPKKQVVTVKPVAIIEQPQANDAAPAHKIITRKAGKLIVVKLPKLFPDSYAKTSVNKEVLICPAPEGKRIVLTFAKSVGKPFEVADGASGNRTDVEIAYISKKLFEGKVKRDVAARAYIKDGNLFWQWRKVRFASNDGQLLLNHLKYAVLRVFNNKAQVTSRCQFVEIQKSPVIKLSGNSQGHTFDISFDGSAPRLVCVNDGGWSAEKTRRERTITFAGSYGAAIIVSLKKAGKDGVRVWASAAKGSSASEIRAETERVKKTIQSDRYRIKGNVERIRSRQKLPKPAEKNVTIESKIQTCLKEVSRRIGKCSGQIDEIANRIKGEENFDGWMKRKVKAWQKLPKRAVERGRVLNRAAIRNDDRMKKILDIYNESALEVEKIKAIIRRQTEELEGDHKRLRQLKNILKQLSANWRGKRKLAEEEQRELANRMVEISKKRKFVVRILAGWSGAVIGELTISTGP